jgi:(2Fe-2S) ferredoxin
MELRDRYLFVCVNRRPDDAPKGSCAGRGSADLYERLRELLRQRGLAKTAVRACSSSCLDGCLEGPIIAVEPDHYCYGRVTIDDLEAIVDALARNERVEALVVGPGHGRAGERPPGE